MTPSTIATITKEFEEEFASLMHNDADNIPLYKMKEIEDFLLLKCEQSHQEGYEAALSDSEIDHPNTAHEPSYSKGWKAARENCVDKTSGHCPECTNLSEKPYFIATRKGDEPVKVSWYCGRCGQVCTCSKP